MSNQVDYFPSGRSVKRCRADAKQLVKDHKQSKLTLSQALDLVAQKNGDFSTWAQAMKELSIQKKTNITTSQKTPRIARQHLMGHALNILIDKNLIDIRSTEPVKAGYVELELLGFKSVINWNDVGHGEIRLSVWWDFDKTKHPQHLDGGYKKHVLLDDIPEADQHKYFGNKKTIYSDSSFVEQYTTSSPLAKKSYYKDFVGVTCSCWIERINGPYLQLSEQHDCFDSYVRSGNKKDLLNIPDCIPNGFPLSGPFHL
jgi:hypothetical protein